MNPADAPNYPRYCMLDAEQEAADEAQAAGYCLPLVLPPNPEMALTFLRRANEDAAAVLASNRRYLLTGKGRVAAERVDAAARAQIERTKETT